MTPTLATIRMLHQPPERAARMVATWLGLQLRYAEDCSHCWSGYQENMNWPPLRLSTTIRATSGRTAGQPWLRPMRPWRSEEHTSELQSLMRISYAVCCLKKKPRSKGVAISIYNECLTHQEHGQKISQ